MLPALDKMPREALLAGITQERKGWPCCFLKWTCGDGDLPLLPLSLHLWGFYTSPMFVWFFSLAEPQSRYQCPFQQFCLWSGFYPFFCVWLCPSGSPTAFWQHKGFCRWLRENLRLGVWKLGRGSVLEPVRSHISYLKGTKSRCWKTCKFSCFSDRLFRKEIKAMEMDRKLFFSLSQIWSCAVFGIQELQKSWYPVGFSSCFTWLF